MLIYSDFSKNYYHKIMNTFIVYIFSLNTEQQNKFMYMYFNHMNLAEKTTMHVDMKSTGHALIPSDIMKLFADFYSDMSK